MCLSENDDVFGKCRTGFQTVCVLSSTKRDAIYGFTRQGSGETITDRGGWVANHDEGFAGSVISPAVWRIVIIKTWILREELKKPDYRHLDCASADAIFTDGGIFQSVV